MNRLTLTRAVTVTVLPLTVTVQLSRPARRLARSELSAVALAWSGSRRTTCPPLSRKAWIEAHYTGVRWDTERSGTALVGRLAADVGPAVRCSRRRTPRIAFQSEDFREYRPEIVMDERGPVVLVRCEELDSESGRWEPFVSTVWRAP
jgi:hypothetical protein